METWLDATSFLAQEKEIVFTPCPEQKQAMNAWTVRKVKRVMRPYIVQKKPATLTKYHSQQQTIRV